VAEGAVQHAYGQRERWIRTRVGGTHGWQGVSPL